LELLALVLRNVVEAADAGGNQTLAEFAGTILGSVWVSRGEFLTSDADDVFEGPVHPTTVATVVSSGASAINKLLLSQVVE